MRSSTGTATTATDRDRQDPRDHRAGYVGRFAPSPTGDLHLGSLYTATAAYLQARAHNGRFLVRIEDLDRPREVPGAADRILATLEAFGFEWDGPVLRQSEHTDRYQDALGLLRAQGRLFACDCSRSRLANTAAYPGSCRSRSPGTIGEPCAWRVRIDPAPIRLNDRLQGSFERDLRRHGGDFVVRRRDGIVAYVLGVVIDDADQGVTEVVRGADLLESTPQQIHLQTLLSLPTPSYAHLPVLTEPDGAKLAKSRRTSRLNPLAPVDELTQVFALLGLDPPAGVREGSLADAWAWALRHWRLSCVPKGLERAL
ncbi:MAG: tRNA glutamyl-Q(34) synthetase GluQRS [Steroidobacteraceae bacterium]|nr:tRNA glutamyl-Q(34) synthetase GluQRS [Steroidobacteraceae bacterium]